MPAATADRRTTPPPRRAAVLADTPFGSAVESPADVADARKAGRVPAADLPRGHGAPKLGPAPASPPASSLASASVPAMSPAPDDLPPKAQRRRPVDKPRTPIAVPLLYLLLIAAFAFALYHVWDAVYG